MSVASTAKLAQENAVSPPNSLNLIAAYIPSEALAVYIFGPRHSCPDRRGETRPGRTCADGLLWSRTRCRHRYRIRQFRSDGPPKEGRGLAAPDSRRGARRCAHSASTLAATRSFFYENTFLNDRRHTVGCRRRSLQRRHRATVSKGPWRQTG